MRFPVSPSASPLAEARPGAPASLTHPRAGAGSCRACPVGRYCAVYAPGQDLPPANCPFGPGPAAPAAKPSKPAAG